MKKFIFGFILCFFGLFVVNASELDLSSLGYSSCLDSEDNLSYQCAIGPSSNGEAVYSNDPNSRVSNYFLVSDTFTITSNIYLSHYVTIAYYDNDYSYLSYTTFNLDQSRTITKPTNAFYARLHLYSTSSNLRIYIVNDDLNGVSSLNYAINSLSHTVSQTLTIITTNTILLIATAIFVIGICLYLIWRIIRGG